MNKNKIKKSLFNDVKRDFSFSLSRVVLWCIALPLVFASCGKSKIIADQPLEKLSDYAFFKGELINLEPAEGVLPYDLNSPLFSDYAHKARFVWMPEGKSAKYTTEGVLDFPEGAVLIKNFYYEKDERDQSLGKTMVETRLLVRGPDQWEAHSYIWDEKQDDAYLEIIGAIKAVSWTDQSGVSQKLDYIVPNKNQCKGCHYDKGVQRPIGPKVRNINKVFDYADGSQNQLIKWSAMGYLEGFDPGLDHPKVAKYEDPASGSIHERALAYLDINCGHCHNPGGPASTTGLNLVADAKMNLMLGINKPPVAAGQGTGGHDYNIVPGKADESILAFRMASNNPSEMMPELGRRTIHVEGLNLIKEWIDQMPEQPIND